MEWLNVSSFSSLRAYSCTVFDISVSGNGISAILMGLIAFILFLSRSRLESRGTAVQPQVDMSSAIVSVVSMAGRALKRWRFWSSANVLRSEEEDASWC